MTESTRPRLAEDRLRRLLEVGRALVAELSIETVLTRILETARDITGARYAALGILDEEKDELERFVFVGIDEETRRRIGPPPRGHGVLGELIRDARPLRLADVTQHERSYGFPPGHPPMKTFLGVPITVRGEAFGNLYLTDKAGGADFDENDQESAMVLAEWAAIAIDNARLFESEARRRAELERAVRGLEATATVARSVGSETHLDRVLELIAKRGRALVDARSLLVLLEDDDVLRVVASVGQIGRTALDAVLPLRGTLAGTVLRTGAPLRVAGLADADYGLEAISGEASSALLVPLGFRGRARGLLMAFDRSEGPPVFDADDKHLLASFGASAAIAIATAQSVESERLRDSIRASEAERRRWARELHDETLQDLGGLKLALEGALRAGSDDALAAATGEAIDHLQFSIESLQNLIAELRPAALDELGLEPAISALAARAAATSGIEIETSIHISPPAGAGSHQRFDAELENAVYRLVQEALTNAAKHAAAEHAWVELIGDGSGLSVTVRDDGSGFAAKERSGGYGLVGMRERVELAGGRLAIESTPGEGTRVSAWLPLSAPA